MTEAHKHTLNRNRVNFIKNLNIDDVLLSILLEDYTLTRDMREEIVVNYSAFEIFTVYYFGDLITLL